MTLDYDDFVGRLVIGRVERGCLRRGATVVRIPESGAPQRFRVTKLFGALRPRPRRARAGARGRPRRDRRRRLDRHRRHDLRPGLPRAAAAHRDRSADRARALLGEQLAVRGPRGQVRHDAPDRRPAAPRSARQRLDQDRGDREPRRLRGRRPRRDADRRADRDDAPRGLRVLGLAARDHPARGRRQELRAGRGRRRRGARDGRRLGDGEALAAPRPPDVARAAQRHARSCTSWCRAAASSATAASSSPTRAARASCTAPCAATSRSRASSRRRCVGAIMATEQGVTTPYALWKIQERCDLFVGPGVPCYEGQIVGQNRRPDDMNVHVVARRRSSPTSAPPARTRRWC